MSKYSEAVERLTQASANHDVTDALCQLSVAQRAFNDEMVALRQRLTVCANPPAEAMPESGTDPIEASIPDRLLQVLWLALVAAAVMAFSVGFWLGRQAH